jgi:hypothetical protein
MRSDTRLVPLDELVLDPEEDAMGSLRNVDPPMSKSNSSPVVMVTPDKRVIAGHAYLNAYKLVGCEVIPCRIVNEDDIDVLLTSIHNKILYREPHGEELSLQLDLYAELCRYRQIGAAAHEKGSSEPSSAPQTDESGTTGNQGDSSQKHRTGSAIDEPAPGVPDAGHQTAFPGRCEVTDRPWADPFWYF